jgi:hypothetical protein
MTVIDSHPAFQSVISTSTGGVQL